MDIIVFIMANVHIKLLLFIFNHVRNLICDFQFISEFCHAIVFFFVSDFAYCVLRFSCDFRFHITLTFLNTLQIF